MRTEYAGTEYSGYRQSYVTAQFLCQRHYNRKCNDIHTPVGTGDKFRNRQCDEYNQRQQLRSCKACYCIDYVVSEMNLLIYFLKQECQNHQHDRHQHILDTFQHQIEEFFFGHQPLPHIEHEHENQSGEYTLLHVTVHQHGGCNQHTDWQEDVHNLRIGWNHAVLTAADIHFFRSRRRQRTTLCHSVERIFHRPENRNHTDNNQRHNDCCNPSVEVERNGFDKVLHAFPRRCPSGGFQNTAAEDGPGGNRNNNTQRCSSRVHNIGQEFTGNLMLVRNLGHAGTNRHGIQIVVDKNYATENPGTN